ncbi:MAG TPA: class I SAM-dependent methyltransferase [Thermoleophilaceae bacterium]|nr:class I SAM-dependent methyltransferase [Thermoleophilaceae bacterium]
MPLPKALRRLTPDSIRDSPRLRSLALGAGWIPPRTMHAPEEAAALASLAAAAQVVVEIGVYEGSSALVLVQAMPPGSRLHLIDPFVDESGWALPAGWGATERATRRVVARAAAPREAPRVEWHVERSQDVGRRWDRGEVDFVFIDGDHSPEAVREDWDVWHPHVKSGGHVAFHDANGRSEGPSQVVDELFYSPSPVEGWEVVRTVESLVVARRF